MRVLSQITKSVRRNSLFGAAFLLIALTMSACGGLSAEISSFIEPTPTFTPTVTYTPTPIPEPTATPEPGKAAESSVIVVPTPEVTIPSGWTVIKDDTRGYSLARPSGWTEVDLRGAQFAQMAGMIGQGGQIADLQSFLDTEDGQSIGVVAIELDMFALMQGKLPTLLNVSVVSLPEGITPDDLIGLVEENMGLMSSFADVTIAEVVPDTINNLPAVRAKAVADLSSVGMDVQLATTVVGLVANDQLYLLTLASRQELAAGKEAEFSQIIGSFRPE